MDAAATDSWNATLEGIVMGADAQTPVVVASSLPDLLPEEIIDRCLDAGVPAVWGLTTGIKVADAMRRPVGDAGRLRDIAAVSGVPDAGNWLAEHEAKELLHAYGIAVPRGGVASNVEELEALVEILDGPLALKLSSARLQHKSDVGALELGVTSVSAARAAFQRLHGVAGHSNTPVLVEQMADPGVELLVAARRDAVVPALVIGLGGIWVEAVGDVAVIPLPADSARIERALLSLRGAALLTGGRSSEGTNLTAVAQLAARVGQLLLDEDLVLIELNPVFARPSGAVAVDAVIRRARR
jgi:acyl-CoA synthetase (NDP forming)